MEFSTDGWVEGPLKILLLDMIVVNSGELMENLMFTLADFEV